MQYVFCRNTTQVCRIENGVIVGMGLVHPVSHPASQFIQLNAGPDDMAVFEIIVVIPGDKLRFQQLQLQRYRQSIFWSSGPETDKTLAGFEHGSGGKALLTIEIQLAVCIGLIGPIQKQLLQIPSNTVVSGL